MGCSVFARKLKRKKERKMGLTRSGIVREMLKRMMKKERSRRRGRDKAFLNRVEKLRRDGGAGQHIPENESLKFKFLPLSHTEITQHP